MARFYTYKSEVPLAPGQTLGFTRGRGYHAKGQPQTEQQQATKTVEDMLAPVIGEIKGRGKTTTENLGGIYEALAQAQGSIAPAVEGIYNRAGNQTAAYAKGFSMALQDDLDSFANEANQILAQQGSPQKVESGGENTADVVFGLGGAIPGTQLQREGAAFAADAARLPGQARTLGAQAQSSAARDVEEQIRKIEAEKPGLIQQALNELRQQQAQQAELELKQAVAESEFGLKTRKQDFNEAATTARIGLEEARVGQGDQRIAITLDRLRQSAEGRRIQQGLQNAKLSLSLDQHELAVKREKRLSKPAGKKGGFTAKQRKDMAQQAFDTARDDFLGFVDDDGTEVPPREAHETLRDLLAAGVPYSIAYRAILRYARTKNSRWKYALKWQRQDKPRRRQTGR